MPLSCWHDAVVTTTAATVIDRFLATITLAGFGDAADLYAPDVHLDATVPGWRFMTDGPAAVCSTYSHWFNEPGTFEELRRIPLPDGEVVEYTFAWTEAGVPHAAHHLHVVTVDPAYDRIVEDRVFCGGRWDAALVTRMGVDLRRGDVGRG